jgi:hypothetical protein
MNLNMIKHASHFFHLVNLNDVDGTGTWDCKNIIGICFLHFITWIFHKDITLLNLKDLTSFTMNVWMIIHFFVKTKSMYNYGSFIQWNK